MTQLATALDAELQKDAPLAFLAVEILFPSYSLRLLDGAAQLTLFGHTFTGRDATYGTVGSMERLEDGTDNTAPTLRLELLVPSNTATAVLASPAAQGSQVSVWMGCVDPADGSVIADPYLVFLGELDVPTVRIEQNYKSLQFDIGSAFERFFDQDEGVRLNGPWHASVWPGELGLEFVTSVQQALPWGSDAPRPVMITDLRSPFGLNAAAGAGNGSGYWRPATSFA